MEAVEKHHESDPLHERVLAVPGKLAGHGLRFSDHVRRAWWNAFQNGVGTTAKAAAYSAVFAIFPALVAAAACVTLLPEMAPLRFEMALFFNRILPANVAPLLEDFFINADKSPQSVKALVISGLVGFSGAAGVVSTLMEGFRRAYDLPLGTWTQWQRRLRAYVLLFIAIVPLTIASATIVFGHLITLWVVEWKTTGLRTAFFFLADVVRWIVALSATSAVFAVLYRYGVPKKLTWREVVPGASFATCTWFISTVAFGWYVTKFADYSRVYGSLGTGIVLMVWLFLTALSILSGAELNAELHGRGL